MTPQTLDIVPATVRTPTQTYQRARAYASDGRIRVFEKRNGAVVLSANEPYVDIVFATKRLQPTLVTLTSGEEWAISRGSGGGCSCNPLRKIDPRTHGQ